MNEEIIIRNFDEGKALLFKDVDHVPNGLLIGVITSVFQLNDIRIQCKKIKSNDYFFLWKNSDGIFCRISIDEKGYLSDSPIGFFDLFDDQLDQLINWQK